MFMDADLARRLEATEGAVCLSYVEPRRQVSGVPAEAIQRDGTVALFDGVDSPLSQTFGLGVHAPTTAEALDELEAFFLSRGTDVMHEVSPFAGVATLALLVARGYHPIELSTVLVQPIDHVTMPASSLSVREIDRERETAMWVDAAVAGWSSDPSIAPLIRAIAEVNVVNRATTHYIVERAGEPIATGSLAFHGDVALLAGASTIPGARGQGAQALILAKRLADAKQRGCTVAMMVADVGSTSQRNAERRGFRVAYTRTKWRLARPSGT
jgi:hypothetical protein